MNIAFFLLPKHEVVCLPHDATLRQALERMEYHRYSAVPIINDEGGYVGTVTEGDLLWFMKGRSDLALENSHKIKLGEVPLRMNNKTVNIDANMDDLISLAKVQNFVPVVDDRNHFIGIVRRSEIIDYCQKGLSQRI